MREFGEKHCSEKTTIYSHNKLAKPWKMRKPSGMLGVKKKFGPGKLLVEKVLAQNICIDFLTELDHSKKINVFVCTCKEL